MDTYSPFHHDQVLPAPAWANRSLPALQLDEPSARTYAAWTCTKGQFASLGTGDHWELSALPFGIPIDKGGGPFETRLIVRRDKASPRGICAPSAHNMKGEMTTEKPKRDKPISYRPPKDKRTRFEAMVAASGLSVNAFLTECVFGRSRHRPGEAQLQMQALARCADIADALREARLSGTDISILAIESALDELRLIRTELMSRKGRRS